MTRFIFTRIFGGASDGIPRTLGSKAFKPDAVLPCHYPHSETLKSQKHEQKTLTNPMEEKTFSSVEHDEDIKSTIGHDPKSADNFLGVRGQWEATLEDARAANTHEHSLSVRSALKAYPWAVCWSLLISLSIIMEGYDTALINSLYAYPTYARRFGAIDPATGTYQIPAGWQSAMSSGSQAGAIIGALANGFIIQRFGYKPAFALGILLMASFVFISFFGMSVGLQAAGQILCGLVNDPESLFSICVGAKFWRSED